ncbi:hypothetical protein, partial [uncultured Roseibium sp.]|uniref:hypothetical protein n=1 Tax=uncultured Roseibium sp. TaxID=1936171 RepID=UPI0026147556
MDQDLILAFSNTSNPMGIPNIQGSKGFFRANEIVLSYSSNGYPDLDQLFVDGKAEKGRARIQKGA